ncbi:PREDICTED: uncharacterized protein LOC108524841 isoform X2 [Rhinopithecus bieti]|uniref:uncharacterized protein LOC108524841 isoform X2 n=1 Tax=Rhinopithecus bieti TaxID=61621 RepID=UPI00083C4A34|nr:PREDICTED: uncharacterized protein LOC108524841 isoform X2 [Rhinopithecus bieti]
MGLYFCLSACWDLQFVRTFHIPWIFTESLPRPRLFRTPSQGRRWDASEATKGAQRGAAGRRQRRREAKRGARVSQGDARRRWPQQNFSTPAWSRCPPGSPGRGPSSRPDEKNQDSETIKVTEMKLTEPGFRVMILFGFFDAVLDLSSD